jgi:hypothetical protein
MVLAFIFKLFYQVYQSLAGGCTKNVFVQALLLSPRAFLSPRAPFLSPRGALFCCPERKRGVPRHLRASG